MGARVTLITSTAPAVLSKQYALVDGTAQATTSASMIRGHAVVREVDDLGGLASVLRSLTPAQALAYGLPPEPACQIMRREDYLREGRPAGTYTRSNDHFSWPDGPAVMMLDYDPEPGGQVMERHALVAAIREAVPGLTNAALLWWPSASSHICHGETDLTGLRGQRIYTMVADGCDIPRAGTAIQTLLWARGHGRVVISQSGQMLLRTLIDAAVYQPSRLDFAAGAACKHPLEQRRGLPVMIPGDMIIDTRTAIPDPDPATVAEAEARIRAAKDAARPQAEVAKSEWIETRVAGISDPAERENARETCRRAVERGVLAGDYRVTLADGQVVTVGQVMDDPARYHGTMTRDPLEPDYRGGKQCGRIYLYGGPAVIYSHAHGGRTYRLRRQPRRVEVRDGEMHATTEAVLDILRDEPDVYDLGETLVTVNGGGRAHVLEPDALFHDLGGRIEFFKSKMTQAHGPVEMPVDPPMRAVKSIMAMGGARKLNILNAVITAPTIRPDYSVLSAPGYDRQTGLLLAARDTIDVPVTPTMDQVRAAIQTVLDPVKQFPFRDRADWSGMLVAILTAAVRAAIPTAPAFGFSAPTQGSGKTLLARCVAILAGGREPAVFPHQRGRDDEEIRKRLFAHLLSGETSLVWDNILGQFDSASIAAFLTSPEYGDRILGKSKVITLPNRSLLLLTGNNLCLAGDMPRRVIPINIDPESETPFRREFQVDPAGYCMAHRLGIIRAALTIITGFHWLANDRAPGRMASFEIWDDLVRQPVAWLGREVEPGMWPDPMDAVAEAVGADPERECLGELLRCWWDQYRDQPVAAAQVLKDTGDPYCGDSLAGIREALSDLVGGGHLTARSLGKVLGNRSGRLVDGMCFQAVGQSSKRIKWKINQKVRV